MARERSRATHYSMIPKCGDRFSDKIMLKLKISTGQT
jgi:hypothetical protein